MGTVLGGMRRCNMVSKAKLFNIQTRRVHLLLALEEKFLYALLECLK